MKEFLIGCAILGAFIIGIVVGNTYTKVAYDSIILAGYACYQHNGIKSVGESTFYCNDEYSEYINEFASNAFKKSLVDSANGKR